MLEEQIQERERERIRQEELRDQVRPAWVFMAVMMQLGAGIVGLCCWCTWWAGPEPCWRVCMWLAGCA